MPFPDKQKKELNIKVVYCSADTALLAEVMRKLRSAIDPSAVGKVFIEPSAQGLAAFDFLLPASMSFRGYGLRVHVYGAPLAEPTVPPDKFAILLKGGDAGILVIKDESAAEPAAEQARMALLERMGVSAAVASTQTGSIEHTRQLVGPKVPVIDASRSGNPGIEALKPAIQSVLAVLGS